MRHPSPVRTREPVARPTLQHKHQELDEDHQIASSSGQVTSGLPENWSQGQHLDMLTNGDISGTTTRKIGDISSNGNITQNSLYEPNGKRHIMENGGTVNVTDHGSLHANGRSTTRNGDRHNGGREESNGYLPEAGSNRFDILYEHGEEPHKVGYLEF